MQESINLTRGLIIPIILHLLVMIPIEGLEKLPILACSVTALFSLFSNRETTHPIMDEAQVRVMITQRVCFG